MRGEAKGNSDSEEPSTEIITGQFPTAHRQPVPALGIPT